MNREYETPAGSVVDVKAHVTAPVSLPTRIRRARRISVGAVVITAGILLGGCTQQMLGNDQEHAGSADDQKDQTPVGSPATPDPSPAPADHLAGKTGQAEEHTVLDAVRVSAGSDADKLAVLFADGKLNIGSAESVLSSDATTVTLDKSCDNLATSADGVAVACDGKLLDINAEGHTTRTITLDGRILSGTFTDDGQAVAGLEGEERLRFFNQQGEETKKQVVSKNLDETILIKPSGDRAERVAVIDRSRTSINDVSIEDQAFNAALRIGQGVGEVNNGRGNDGVIVASDHRQQQFQLFTMNDVVRLHQEAPTGPSPWATLWDFKRQLAWVSTTGDNKLTGYSVKSGVPEATVQLDTIANVRAVLDTPDGKILLLAENGQWQLFSAKDIQAAQDKGVPGAQRLDQRIIGGQE